MSTLQTKKCLICKRKNDTLHWHIDPDTKHIWVWCNGKCQRGYSLFDYCKHAGVSLKELLQCEFDFKESTPNEVRKMDWPAWFIPLTDSRAQKGVEYIKSRGLSLDGDMYYDLDDEAIVFPYYFQGVFVGAQMRLLTPIMNEEGEVQKMDTLPGTRLGYLFYNWSQEPLPAQVKGVIVTEGAFNSIAIQQALNLMYGGIIKNPWRVIAASGSGASDHQRETMKELKDAGYKIVVAPDTDEAGLKMLKKFKETDSMTHWAMTGDTEKDWNDVLKEMGHAEFAKYFISRIQSVKEKR